ncbi:hypothetical protein G6F62_015711 [Rhizopus arrhizus]|nr:hypothetical protein G6F68_014309 [Rhizopus microsporus]KAG1304453.1 hypothetical protein G6F62_015711 [Rhizopus arrhizus]
MTVEAAAVLQRLHRADRSRGARPGHCAAAVDRDAGRTATRPTGAGAAAMAITGRHRALHLSVAAGHDARRPDLAGLPVAAPADDVSAA